MSQLTFDKDSVARPQSPQATDGQPESLADILGTYDVQILQSAIAALHNRNAQIFVRVTGCDVTFYNRVEIAQGEYREEIDDVETDYHEWNAKLLPETVTKVIGEQGRNFLLPKFLAPKLGPKDLGPQYQLAVPTLPVG